MPETTQAVLDAVTAAHDAYLHGSLTDFARALLALWEADAARQQAEVQTAAPSRRRGARRRTAP
jgi:hypothetical protein